MRFRQNVLSKFSPKVKINKSIKRTEQLKDKEVEVVKLSSLILARLFKEILEKSKFFSKKSKKAKKPKKPKILWLYVQVSVPNISKILELKKNFPSLLVKKIENIYRTINNSGKVRSKINMITKEPFRKQIIVLIGNNNKAKFIASLGVHITNINSILRNIKSNIIADFVRTNQHNIIIMINKVISTTDLQTIENYIKNTDHLDSEDIETSCLPQSKFYLKIISIPYLIY